MRRVRRTSPESDQPSMIGEGDSPASTVSGRSPGASRAWSAAVDSAGNVLTPERTKTPRAAVDKLNATFNTVLQNPRIRKRLEEVSLNIAGGTPEQFGAHMKAEYEKWGKVIAANNIKVE